MSGSNDGGGNDRDQGYGTDDYENSFNPYPLNAALPGDARWVVPPTLQNLQKGLWPSIESIDPSLYAGGINGGPGYVIDPASGGRISVVPWQQNPAYNPGNNPLIVSPAIPLPNGTLDQAAGTYADPPDTGGVGTFFNYDLGTGYATPTQQSLQEQLANVQAHHMGPFLSLLTEAPFMATAALASAAIPAMLAPLAGGLGSAVSTAGSGLLGDALGAVQAAKPIVGAAQDVMKVASLLNPPRPQTSPLR